jgi:hypothetical protein
MSRERVPPVDSGCVGFATRLGVERRTAPQLHPALLRLSAISSQYFTKVQDFASCGFCGQIRSDILHGVCVDVLRDFDGERQKMMRRLCKIRANFDNKR